MNRTNFVVVVLFWRVLSLWNHFYNSLEREENVKWQWNVQRWTWNFYSTLHVEDKIALVETLQLETDHIWYVWSANKTKLLRESHRHTNGCTHFPCLSYLSGCHHPSYLPNFQHDFTIFQHKTYWPLTPPMDAFILRFRICSFFVALRLVTLNLCTSFQQAGCSAPNKEELWGHSGRIGGYPKTL